MKVFNVPSRTRRTYARAALGSLALAMTSVAASADINGFGDLSGFTVNQTDDGTPPSLNAGVLHITTLNGPENRSVFFNTPQNIAQFSASFTYRATGTPDNIIGAAFVLQNSAAGATAISQAANFKLGYNGFPGQSAAVSLELNNGAPSGTSLYKAGFVDDSAIATGSVNLLSGDPIDVVLSYNGSTLSESMFDTVTSSSFSTSYPIDLPALLGGSTAFVGFTANTGNASFNVFADQYLSNVHFPATPEPGSLSVLALACTSLLRRRCRGLC